MIDLISSLWNETLQIYLSALFVVGIIGVIQICSLLTGIPLIGWVDEIIPEVDTEGFSQYLGWLGIGVVPFIIVILTFMFVFGMLGIAVHNMTGYTLPNWLIIPIVLTLTLILTRFISSSLAKVVPKTTTTAVTSCTLIGKIAYIEVGDATEDLAAEAFVKDDFGIRHNILVKPLNETLIKQGSEVILVKQESSNIFLVDSDYSKFL